jgi:putative ABC transport system permease protein
VNLTTIAVRNVARNKLRLSLTAIAVAVAILAFIMLRTLIWSWTAAMDQAAADRIGSRHKVSMIMPLPKRYAEEIKQIPGVTQVAYASWFGAKYPKKEDEFFATIAVEPDDILRVYDEIKVPAAEVEAWKQNRRGALVGDALAKKLGWKVGDRVMLRGTIYPGDWEFEVSGIYTASRASVDRSTFWFHYDYMNDSPTVRQKDQIGWIMARVKDPGQSAAIAKAIDKHFEERDQQTLSMNERAFQASFLGMMSAILKAIDIVSVVILAIMALILGNTIAMGVRERTGEYGVLRAIGFLPKHIVTFILVESVVTGLIGGGIGVLLSYPLVERGLGRWLEENMGAFFPFFRIDPLITVSALALSLALGLLAAIIPARTAANLKVIDSLRRVG